MRHGFRDIETSVGTTPLWLTGVFVSDEPLAVTEGDDVIEVALPDSAPLENEVVEGERGTASGACPQPCSTVATEGVSTAPRWMLVRPSCSRSFCARAATPSGKPPNPQSERRLLGNPPSAWGPFSPDHRRRLPLAGCGGGHHPVRLDRPYFPEPAPPATGVLPSGIRLSSRRRAGEGAARPTHQKDCLTNEPWGTGDVVAPARVEVRAFRARTRCRPHTQISL
jgi:hypothetical protein